MYINNYKNRLLLLCLIVLKNKYLYIFVGFYFVYSVVIF